MKFNDDRLCKNATLILLLSYFLSFLIYYIPNFAVESEVLAYISTFVRRCVYLLIPISAAYIALIGASFLGVKWAVLRLIPMMLVRMIYLLPLFYLMLLADGFDSIEGLLIGLGLSLGEALIAYGLTLLLFFAMRFIQGYKRDTDTSCDLLPSNWLDLSNKTNLACALVSLAAFLYFFVSEIIDTVLYIIKYNGYYRTGEIIYIIFSFIYDIALLFVYYLTFILIKRILSKRMEK